MKITKRIISCILTLALLSGMVYVPAGAAETAVQTDNGEVTVSGTNSFGELLSDEIASVQTQQEQAAEGFEVGYAVTGLEFSGNTATVTCEAKESALVVVAVYTEDAAQLLLSGTAEVGPETTQTIVTIQGEMPQYFYAAAYLMDPQSYSPLCSSYTTPMYTQEMQQLLSSTVEDYDADRVYNLDNDNSTNFAVFGDDVILLREQEGVNTVITADDENKIYVLENPDATVTGLAEGNVVAYCYGDGQILMVKVASVQISGTTATITGGELQMEDVFSYVKIEENASGSEMTVDDAEADEGVTYEGAQGGTARAAESETTTKWAHVFKLDKTLPGDGSSEDAKREAEFKGSLTFGLDLSVKYYIALNQQYFDVKIDGRISLTGSISGKAEFENIKLGRFDCALVPGVYVHMKPAVAIHFEGEASIEASYTYTLGFAVENGWGKGIVVQNRTTKPKLDAVLKFEGSLFFGVDMNPSISILSEGVAKAEMTDLIGLEIKGKIEKSVADALDEDALVHHGCSACLAGEVNLKLSVSVDVQLLDREELSLDLKILDLKAKLTDFYWSLEHGTFALTACPYRSYRTSVVVTDAEGNAVADTEVTMSNEDTATTDENGIAIFYLPAGMYTVSAVIDETEYDVRFYVKHAARKVALDPYAQDEVFTTLDPNNFWQLSNIIATGKCGPTVYWALYDDGLLYIYGEGDMYGYTLNEPSWEEYKNEIYRVIVEDGVTCVARYAFDQYHNLTEVYLAGSVKRVITNAFAHCDNLETVVLNEGLVEIDQCAFEWCPKLANIQLPTTLEELRMSAFEGCSSIKEITIPCWVGSYVFYNCDGLEKVTFLDGATFVREYAFMDCNQLKEVHFGASIYELEYYAFSNCDSLTEIRFPDSMTYVGQSCFTKCDNLETVIMNEGLKEIDQHAFERCPKLVNVQLPTTLEDLRAYAFFECKSLKEITIPCWVGGDAFGNCSSLEKVTFLDTATSVKSRGFCNCDSLKEVHFGASIYKLEDYAFYDCDALTEIYFPDSMTNIGQYVFADCDALETAQLNEGLTEIANYAFANCEKLVNIQLPTTLQDLRSYAFFECKSLKEITIPCWVGSCAFEKCSSLEKVTFLDTATSVKSGGFRNCDSLKEVHFGASIYKLEDYAFYDCDALTEIRFPDSMTNIGQYVFADCDALVTAQLNEGLLEISSYAFNECGNLAEVNIPSTLTNLRSHAFYKCKSLKEVTIPCYVGDSAFYGCSALEKVTFLEGARYVGTYAFAECHSLREVTLAEGMESVDNYGFYNCDSLTQIRIPASITSIGQYAFSKCDNLTAVELNEGLLEIASYAFAESGKLADISIPSTVNNLRSYAFYRCGSLKEVTLPCYAGSSAFYGCASLEKVTFLEGATSVGTYAFAECTALREVTLAEGMTAIKENAFRGCTALTQMVIPGTVTSIESNAFNNCKNLTQIWFRGDAPKFGSSAFSKVTVTAYYPEGNATWTADVMKNYGGTVTWEPYTPEAGVAAAAAEHEASTAVVSLCLDGRPEESAVSTNAFHSGEHSDRIIDGAPVHTATFRDLVPGQEYLLLVLVSMEAEDLLAADNLLYIDQAAANADGTLEFSYVQRVQTTDAYVMVCGPATRNIADADITFPDMAAEGGHQLVQPTVVYDGETLTEGVDYIITGTVDFDAPGEYICYIEGIHNYTGVVECVYTVVERLGILGDVNGDEEVDVMDANLVIAYYYGNVELDEIQQRNADVNGDAEIDVMDANLIIAYYYGNIDFFPAEQ